MSQGRKTIRAKSNLIQPVVSKIIRISRRIVRGSNLKIFFHEGWIQIIQSFKNFQIKRSKSGNIASYIVATSVDEHYKTRVIFYFYFNPRCLLALVGQVRGWND